MGAVTDGEAPRPPAARPPPRAPGRRPTAPGRGLAGRSPGAAPACEAAPGGGRWYPEGVRAGGGRAERARGGCWSEQPGRGAGSGEAARTGVPRACARREGRGDSEGRGSGRPGGSEVPHAGAGGGGGRRVTPGGASGRSGKSPTPWGAAQCGPEAALGWGRGEGAGTVLRGLAGPGARTRPARAGIRGAGGLQGDGPAGVQQDGAVGASVWLGRALGLRGVLAAGGGGEAQAALWKVVRAV